MGPQVRIRQDTAHSRVSEMGSFYSRGVGITIPSTGPVYLGTSAIRGCICICIYIYIHTHTHTILSSQVMLHVLRIWENHNIPIVVD